VIERVIKRTERLDSDDDLCTERVRTGGHGDLRPWIACPRWMSSCKHRHSEMLSEYTTPNKLGTDAAVCFERGKYKPLHHRAVEYGVMHPVACCAPAP